MEGVSEYKTVYIKGNPYDTEYWKKLYKRIHDMILQHQRLMYRRHQMKKKNYIYIYNIIIIFKFNMVLILWLPYVFFYFALLLLEEKHLFL